MRRKGWMVAALLLVLIGAAAGAWAWRRLAPYPEVGSVYIAQQVCACVFVAGRPENACRAEFQPDIGRFHVRVSRAGRGGMVQTRLLLFRGASRYDPGYGCTIVR